MGALILSILMLAGLLLLAGGLVMLMKYRRTKQGWLMIVAALVMFGNVVISAIPGPEPLDFKQNAAIAQ